MAEVPAQQPQSVAPGQLARPAGVPDAPHWGNGIQCIACHKDANLQDDRVPMPPIDDPVRQQVNRRGFNECAHCHAGGKWAGSTEVHKKHVERMWQWCYNCHERNDGRPLGTAPPVTQPSQACQLCHSGRNYNDSTPFNIHKKHVDNKRQVKCYACHQA